MNYAVRKAIKNFRNITWNVEENLIQHEIFRVVSRFPRYISYYIAESRLPLRQCITSYSNLQRRWDSNGLQLPCTLTHWVQSAWQNIIQNSTLQNSYFFHGFSWKRTQTKRWRIFFYLNFFQFFWYLQHGVGKCKAKYDIQP